MSRRATLRLATRGSDLALRQARAVQATLEEHRHEVELVEVQTTGDEMRDELIHQLGKTGAFVRSLDEKVLEGEVDGAIHSMKDMPTESPADLVVAGIPERAPAGDLLVTPDGSDLADLPDGAMIGTSSLRRRAQLRSRRPDLEVAPLRGNVDTRVEKLLAPHLQREHESRLDAAEDEDDDAYDRTVEAWFNSLAEIERRALERRPDTVYDGIVLAAAGLQRIGLHDTVGTYDLPLTEFVPAPGQGAIAVTAIEGTDAADAIHAAVDHPRTRVETTVERTILATLGGGCVAPIGVNAVIQGEHVHVIVSVLDIDGADAIEVARDLPVRRHAEAARDLAADLAEQGAATMIERAQRDADSGEQVDREDEEP